MTIKITNNQIYGIMKKTFTFLFLILSCYWTFAQTISIDVSGKVTDESGLPLAGVNILEKGTSNGTLTDFDGNYTIAVSQGSILVFSYVGMKTIEVVGDQATVDVIMQEDAAKLDEVVVIGYGTATRKDITGSVASIKIEDSPIALQPTTNVLQTLQGTVPGVSIGAVASAGGTPGLLIRGQNSISGGNGPLIVLDGVIFDGGLNEVPSDDIASIDVLKDASSAAIYGSRAANGVILITTKRGKTGKPTINLNHYVGVQEWSRIPDMMLGEEFLDWRTYNLSLTGQQDLSIQNILDPKEYQAYQNGQQLEWFDEISQYAPIQNYQLSVSGSNDKTNYYLSGSFLDQKGVLANDSFKKPSVTAKLETKIDDWLKVGANIYYNSMDFTGISPDIYIATYYTPYSNKWLDGREGEVLDRFPTNNFLYNPFWGNPNSGGSGMYDDDMDKQWGIRGTGYVEVDIPKIEGLTFRFDYTGRRNVSRLARFAHEFKFVDPDVPDQLNDPSRFLGNAGGFLRTNTSQGWVMNNLLTYKKTFGDHRVDAVLGYTRDYTRQETVQFSGADFGSAGSTVLGFYGLELANPEKKSGVSNYTDFSNVGYLARLNYSYKGRYHLTGSYRRDGYSAFAPGFKFGNFSGASIAWTASEESFIKDNIPSIDFLKFRMSYGENGNQAISPYSTLANVGGGSTVFGSQTFNTSFPSSLANKSLTWETTKSFNFGVNFSLFNNRLSGDIDIYKSETTDQLQNLQLPVFTGFGSVITNIGQVDNKGVEVSLNTINIKNSNFEWKTGIVFSLNRNKLVSLTGLDADGDGVEDDDIGNRWFIGKSLGAIYDYTVDGIVQTEDTDYINTFGVSPGDLKIRDIDGFDDDGNLTGQPDGQINGADRSVIGYSVPNYRANISNTLTYNNFQLYFDINIIAGGGKDNYYLAGNRTAFLPIVPTVGRWIAGREYWRPDRQSNVVPRPNYGNPFGYGFWQDRAFARLQNITLSYNFNSKLKDYLGVKDLKIFVTGKNLFTETDWVGLDPENAGQVGGSSPVLKTFTAGLNLSF